MLDCIWWYILVYTSSYWYFPVYCSRTEYIAVFVGILKIQKLCMTAGFEPETSRIITSMLDSFATSVTSTVTVCNLDGICSLVLLKTLFFTWWLVSYVRRRSRRATSSGHNVASLGFNMYFPKAKAYLSTAAAGQPRQKQAAAGQLAGGGAVNAHEAGHCAASESCARGRRACTGHDCDECDDCHQQRWDTGHHCISCHNRRCGTRSFAAVH